MEMNRKTVKIWAGLIAFGVILNVVVHNVDEVGRWMTAMFGILTPILLGFSIAFLLNIPVSMLEKYIFKKRRGRISAVLHKIRRPLSITISLVTVIAALVGVVAIVAPQLTRALTGAIGQLRTVVDGLRVYLTEYEDEAPELVRWLNSLNIDWEGIKNWTTNFLKNGIGSAASIVTSAATSVFGTATNLVLALILAINVLCAKETLSRQSKAMVRAYVKKERAEKTIEIGQMAHRVFTAFVSSQVTEALILATLCYLGMLIFRFPYAFLVSVVVGITALVPIFGAWAATAVGAILILTVEPVQALWFVVFFVILQQIEGNLIYPRVVGTQVGLPAMWVLIAITIGGGTLGITGMLLGVPTFAVLYALTKKSLGERLDEKEAAGEIDEPGTEAAAKVNDTVRETAAETGESKAAAAVKPIGQNKPAVRRTGNNVKRKR